MNLYVGLLLEKKTSGRWAQIAALDKDYVYLTWDDNGAQTRVQRDRFHRDNKWAEVVGYQT